MPPSAPVIMVANLLHPTPDATKAEIFEHLFSRSGVRVERIISHGQTTPVDAPYVQEHEEWVLVVAGHARLWIDGHGDTDLRTGDHCLIPAHAPHRVTYTSPDEPTIWLALHFDASTATGGNNG